MILILSLTFESEAVEKLTNGDTKKKEDCLQTLAAVYFQE